MNNFKKPSRFGGGNRGGDRKSFGGGRDRGGFGGGRDNRGGGRDFGPKEMHEATCANCGNKCQVPFRPTGNKPVYCDNCFATMGDKGNSRGDRGGRNDREDRGGRKDFGSRNTYKPVVSEAQNETLKNQIEMLHQKIDALTNLIQGSKPVAKTAPIEKTTKKALTAKKVVATKKVAVKKAVKKVAKKAVTKGKK